MKNFKKLIINNFQNHKHTEIDFSEGITVFVGKTDCGKTAIFRAIKLILKNKPRGNGFISVFAEKEKKQKPTTSVSLVLEDDTEITRIKSENANKYIVKKLDKEEVFENFGVNIPPEILEEIGPNSVMIDTDTFFDINISEQLAPPFLLTDSPSVKTKVIDKVAKIDILNKAIKNNHTKLQNRSTEEKQIQKEIEILETELTNFDNLETEQLELLTLKNKIAELIPLQEKLKQLHEISEKYKKVNESIAIGSKMILDIQTFLETSSTRIEELYVKINHLFTLINLKEQIQKVSTEINKENIILSEKETILKSDEEIKKLIYLINTYISLSTLSNNYNNNNTDIQKTINEITKNREITRCDKDIQELKDLLQKINTLLALKEQHDTLTTNINIAHNYIPNQQNKLFSEKEQLKQLFRQLKICPLCHSEITEQQINNLV